MCFRAKLLAFIKSSTPSPCLQYCISVTSGCPGSFPFVFSHSLILIISLNIHFIMVLYSQIKSCVYLKIKIKRCRKTLSISIQQRPDRPPEAHSSLTGSCRSTLTNECHHITPEPLWSVRKQRDRLTSLLSYLSSFLHSRIRVRCSATCACLIFPKVSKAILTGVPRDLPTRWL